MFDRFLFICFFYIQMHYGVFIWCASFYSCIQYWFGSETQTGENNATWAGMGQSVTPGSKRVTYHVGKQPTSVSKIQFTPLHIRVIWSSLKCKYNAVSPCREYKTIRLLCAPVESSAWSWECVKGDPASLHGSVVRPIPQREDPRDPRVTHSYAQPLTEEGAAPAWNPILLTNGSGHPHQLSCGW